MKLWVDDIRAMPKGYDKHVKTSAEAIELLAQGVVEEISLDHDLGGEDSGYFWGNHEQAEQ